MLKGVVSDEINNMFSNPLEGEFTRNSPLSLFRIYLGPGHRGCISKTTKKATKSEVCVFLNPDDKDDTNLGYIKLGKPYLIPQLKIIQSTEGITVQIINDKRTIEEPQIDEISRFLLDLKEKYDPQKVNVIEETNLSSTIIHLGYLDKNFNKNWKCGRWYLAISDKNCEKEAKEIISEIIQNLQISNEKIEYGSGQVSYKPRVHFNKKNYYRICAKIAFNFLAYSKGSEFALRDIFDPIRNWIVSGEGENTFVYTNSDIEAIFSVYRLPNLAHTIVILKSPYNELICLLKLYGNLNCVIRLCSNYNDEFIIDGMICDWKNQKEYSLAEYILIDE